MIKIKGHSNFDVEIKSINNNYYITKSSDIKNMPRLEKQINKQIYLFKNNFLNNCKIPQVYNKIKENDKLIYYMEYIKNSVNLIDFFSKDNSIKNEWLYKNIVTIIENYIEKCEYKQINNIILEKKIQNVKNNIKSNKFCKSIIPELEKYFNYLQININQISKLYIPINICHGDLTFSNILIDTNNMKLYLIDFLDSFIETPLLDIIKIRQDTYFNWTINMCNFSFDKNKTLIALNYIDNKINDYFQKYEWYNEGYKFFQILNILRILQYCKYNKVQKRLLTYLKII